MKKLFSLLVLSCCVIAVMATDQKQPEPIDTLLERFDNKPGLKTAREFFAYMDKEEFMDEPVVFTTATPLDTMKALVWYWAGEWYYAEQEYTLAEKNLLRALELMEYADEKSISDNLAMLGLTCMRQSKYDEALHYMRRCYQLDSKSGDPDRMSSSLNMIAGTLLAAGNPEEAEGYILRAITYAKRANTPPPSRTAVIFGMASEIENRLEHKERALLYADSACMVEATTGNNYKMAVRQTQKASILVSMERYEEAEKMLAEVVPYFREAGDQLSLAIALNKRGQAARYLGHLDDAVEYLSESIEICQRIGNPYNEAYAQRAIYEILYKSNPDAARMHLERYHLLKDSLYSHATAEQLARFNAEFGRDELEKEKEQLTRRNHRLAGIGVAVAVGAILCVLGSLIWFRRRQSKTNELLSTVMTELNEARRSPAPAAEQETEPEPEENVEYLTQEDKTFLKKLILSVTQMMDHQAVTVTQIADKMCMSPKTLNRRVKYLTGEGAKRYMMRIQLEQARIMLLQDLDIPIVEVGNCCGFDDHSSFTRTFTQNVGMSPSDYRLNRGKMPN